MRRPTVMRPCARSRRCRRCGYVAFKTCSSSIRADRWERELQTLIDNCDLFLIFWSSAARRSTWVRKEVEYVLALKKTELDPPEIKPYILERVEPWPELAHLHWDDRLVYFLGRGGLVEPA
jgi:hypothetical protein